MLPDRAGMEVEDLLKIILVLIIIYIAVDLFFGILDTVFQGFSSIVGLLIVVLIIAYFLDYI